MCTGSGWTERGGPRMLYSLTHRCCWCWWPLQYPQWVTVHTCTQVVQCTLYVTWLSCGDHVIFVSLQLYKDHNIQWSRPGRSPWCVCEVDTPTLSNCIISLSVTTPPNPHPLLLTVSLYICSLAALQNLSLWKYFQNVTTTSPQLHVTFLFFMVILSSSNSLSLPCQAPFSLWTLLSRKPVPTPVSIQCSWERGRTGRTASRGVIPTASQQLLSSLIRTGGC